MASDRRYGPYDLRMTDREDRVGRALQDTLEAVQDARRALSDTEKEIRKALRRSARGGSPTSAAALRENPVSQAKKPLDEALNRLERVRHDMLLATFVTALDDGMPIGELGRIYGFSRQRAARLAKEARESDARVGSGG